MRNKVRRGMGGRGARVVLVSVIVAAGAWAIHQDSDAFTRCIGTTTTCGITVPDEGGVRVSL